jgi:hypothetical protein
MPCERLDVRDALAGTQATPRSVNERNQLGCGWFFGSSFVGFGRNSNTFLPRMMSSAHGWRILMARVIRRVPRLVVVGSC